MKRFEGNVLENEQEERVCKGNEGRETRNEMQKEKKTFKYFGKYIGSGGCRDKREWYGIMYIVFSSQIILIRIHNSCILFCPEASLIKSPQIEPFLCTAVHTIIPFSASISHLLFLLLFNCIPKARWDTKKQTVTENKRE